MPKSATKPETTTALFAPPKRSHLYAVSTSKQREKLYSEIDHNVRQLVSSDEDAHALAFLIDTVSGVYRAHLTLGNDRSSDLPPMERTHCAIRILERLFLASTSHSDALIAWLGLEDAKPSPAKKAKVG